MVLLVVEGAIRKWLFPGAQDLVYLAKDVILLGAYAGFVRQRAQLRYRPPALPILYSALAFGAVVGLLQIFNPRLPNLMVGAFGFKAYFLYVPILFILPAVFPLGGCAAFVRGGAGVPPLRRVLPGLASPPPFGALFGVGAFSTPRLRRAPVGALESRPSFPFFPPFDILPAAGLEGYGIGA